MKNWLILTALIVTTGCNRRSVRLDPVADKHPVSDSVTVVEIPPKPALDSAPPPVSPKEEVSPLPIEMAAEPNFARKPAPVKHRRLREAKAKRSGKSLGMMDHLSSVPRSMAMGVGGYSQGNMMAAPPAYNTESYDAISENGFKSPLADPLSTFSIDVDAASYANMRRFLNNNQLPPEDAVRVEELINYFDYAYEPPQNKEPFSINTEVSECPWNSEHKLVHIGLQGKKVENQDLPPSNLVFLLDVSGSMNSPNKLPLLKKAFGLLVEQLDDKDRVSVVVYAGAAGLVLPSTRGNEKRRILDALNKLQAGGSTAGGAGIHLAYRTALENLIQGGNNRVILATDGDFNIGTSSDGEMVRLIEEKRKSGVLLTVLGFGTGNYKDSKMEKLADKGNGNYAYIDNLLEAKKVLVSEMGGTLFTIAKDVKIQVEFNPANVQAYRLVGYENRLLNAEDFNDDKKDAGELGAGHTVTALYEVVPPGVKMKISTADELKYQKPGKKASGHGTEILTVKFRYKAPSDSASRLIVHTVADKPLALSSSSDNFRFSSAVAGFGMLLRKSEYAGSMDYTVVLRLAKEARGKDENGYRAEFIKLIEMAQALGAAAKR